MRRLRIFSFMFGAVIGALTGKGRRKRIVEEGSESPGAELALVGLLLLSAIFAIGFVVVLATGSWPNRTQYEGIALGGSLLLMGFALVLVSKRLIVTEELEEDYPEPEHPEEQNEVTQIVRESGSRFTRKRLVQGAFGAAAGALGVAAIAPAISFGPALDPFELNWTPWRRGKRLVTEDGAPVKASDIEMETFYTAYPEHSARDNIAAPVVIVRLRPSDLRLPRGRRNWAPQGILAYSKICTHAGCAIALYRKPTFPPVQPDPALVCPCHYSTFDPAAGGKVLFGPAGRNLPQLPLLIDSAGHLRAAGNFSGPVGPSWWGVRMKGPITQDR
ncbi:MAG TPA: Rieske 2Fe-2S domain-containing protein [Thermoleophilaceae bacterium]|nr:Rieske 2Fe-2S domain-containing protein [Thermoleophilaceae bacterium]